jgi:hypothetical protein
MHIYNYILKGMKTFVIILRILSGNPPQRQRGIQKYLQNPLKHQRSHQNLNPHQNLKNHR